MTEAEIQQFFARYERFFERSLAGGLDADEIAAIYAPEFIAASPAGVRAGKNDEQLKQMLAQGYEYYRQIGTKAMRIRYVGILPMDEHHCVAHVAWTATYARKQQSDAAIDFEVHYLVQQLNGEPRIFGWVAGDETALLKQHGIV